jgi:hypothetical protein
MFALPVFILHFEQESQQSVGLYETKVLLHLLIKTNALQVYSSARVRVAGTVSCKIPPRGTRFVR